MLNLTTCEREQGSYSIQIRLLLDHVVYPESWAGPGLLWEWLLWRHGSQRPCASNKLNLALAHREEARDVSWTWRWTLSVSALSTGKQLRPRPRHPPEWTRRDARGLPEYSAAFHPLYFKFFKYMPRKEEPWTSGVDSRCFVAIHLGQFDHNMRQPV